MTNDTKMNSAANELLPTTATCPMFLGFLAHHNIPLHFPNAYAVHCMREVMDWNMGCGKNEETNPQHYYWELWEAALDPYYREELSQYGSLWELRQIKGHLKRHGSLSPHVNQMFTADDEIPF